MLFGGWVPPLVRITSSHASFSRQNGPMATIGSLRRSTRCGWMVVAPAVCPNGHQLGPERLLVGHQPCSCPGGHTTWTCIECGAVTYAPPTGPGCRVLHGAAAVR
jgi:hypothetical protein